MTRPRVWPEEILAFVRERVTPETCGWPAWLAISDAVNEKWPTANMTRQSARRIGRAFKNRTASEKKAAAVPVRQCRYQWLDGGELHRCEAEGYPHCANHKKKLTQVPSGSRFGTKGEFTNVY